MASRILSSALQTSMRRTPAVRNFTTSPRRLDVPPVAPAALPAKRPVGAFRGGLTGFLLGSVLSGAGMYYYVLNEYRVSNELLTEDIFNLQSTVQRIEAYVKVLEDKVETKKK